MMSALSGIAKLRAALWQMEKDLGLEDLNRNERDLLYAFHVVAAQSDGTTDISSDQVRHATAVDEMKHATELIDRILYRAALCVSGQHGV